MGLGPLPAVPNVVRLAVRGSISARNWANVLHFSWSGAAPGDTGCLTIAEGAATGWTAEMQALQDGDTAMTEMEVTDLTSDTAGQGTYDTTSTGTRAGSYLPASASFLVSYATSRRYRGGHPRTYLSVGVQADLDSAQLWAADFQAEVSAAWQAFIGGMLVTWGSTTLTGLVAIQYKHLDKSLVPPAEVYNTPPIVLGLTAADAGYERTLGTQRRRIRKR